jgi:hypothetical protein
MTLFDFIARHARFLLRVPLAPHLFDALLLTHTALFHRDRLRRIEALETFALALSPEITATRHRYGGSGFKYNNTEIAHIHGNALVDILLTRERAAAAVAQNRAQPHHLCGPSAWVSIWLHSDQDYLAATDLLNESLKLKQNCPASRTPHLPKTLCALCPR